MVLSCDPFRLPIKDTHMKSSDSTHHSYPSFSLFFGLLGSAILGFLIGFIYLVSIPPKAVSAGDKPPDTADSVTSKFTYFNNRIYYYRNSGFRQNAQALTKKLYASPTNQIEVTSLELNAWAAAYLEGDSSQVGSDNTKSTLSIHPEVPNFQIAENLLNIAYPVQLAVWNQKWNLMMIASGDFPESDPASPRFKLTRLSINSARVPFKDAVFQIAEPRILKAVSENEEIQKLQTAWKMIKSISIGDTTLNVVRK